MKTFIATLTVEHTVYVEAEDEADAETVLRARCCDALHGATASTFVAEESVIPDEPEVPVLRMH